MQAVIVVTPAQHHFKLVKMLLENGKDVLVEKPLTATLEQAKELVSLAKKKKRILMVDHTFEFNTAINKMKELLDNCVFGKVYLFHGAYNALGPIRRDVSALWDLPHFIYVVTYLLGEMPLSVIASGKDYLVKGMEDVVFLTLEYSNKVLFNLYCSWIDPVKIRRLVLVGDKKMGIFDDMQPEEKLRIYDKGIDLVEDPNFANLKTVLRSNDVIIPKIESREPLKDLVLEFLASIKSRKIIHSSGKDGLDLVRVLTAAQKSLELDGIKIFIKDIA